MKTTKTKKAKKEKKHRVTVDISDRAYTALKKDVFECKTKATIKTELEKTIEQFYGESPE